MKRGGEDQSCGEKLALPQDLSKWKPRWDHAFLSTLLSLYLWRTLLGHRPVQNRILPSFRKVYVDLCTWYRENPACQREFLGFDIRSSDRYFSLVHCKWLYVAPNWRFCWKLVTIRATKRLKDCSHYINDYSISAVWQYCRFPAHFV